MDFKKPCPRSQSFGRRMLGLCMMVLAIALTVILPGCGSSGSSSSGPAAKAFQDVIFHFNNYAAETAARAVPEGTASVRFTGTDDSRQVLYGAVSKPYAPIITLKDVSVKTTGFILEYLGSDNSLLGIYSVKPLGLTPYRELNVEIGDCPAISEVVSSIQVTPSDIKDLAVGYDETLTAIAILADGQILDVSKYVVFTSADEAVASVEGNKVTAVAGGDTVVTGTLLGMETEKVNVNVNPGVIATSLTLSSEELKIPAGHSRNLQAVLHFNNGNTKVISDAVWTAEPAEGVVALTANGKLCEVEAIGAVGETAVVTAATADGTLQASCSVSIFDGTISSLTIERTDDPAEGLTENQIFSYGEGSTAQFKATALYSSGDEMDVTSEVEWVSSNTEAAAFDEAEAGLLKGVTADASTTVTASLDGTESEGIDIEVIYAGIVELNIDVDAERILIYQGGNYSVKVSATYANGVVKDVTTDDETTYEFCLTSGKVSKDYVSFTKDESTGTTIINGVAVTTGGYLHVTRTDDPNVSADKNLVVVKDAFKSIVVTLKDNVGKVWTFDATSQNNEIAVPLGRSYSISIEAETFGGESGDITGSCDFEDKYSVLRTAPQFDAPVVLMNKDEKTGISHTGVIDSYPYEYELDPVTKADIIDRPYYTWESEDITSYPTKWLSYKVEEDEVVAEEHEFVSENGMNQIVVFAPTTREELFRINMAPVRPAIDEYGHIFCAGDDFTTMDVHRGTEYTTALVALKSNDGALDRGVSVDDIHVIPESRLTVDVDTFNRISFMKNIEAAGDAMMCQDYTCEVPLGTKEEILYTDSQSEEAAGYGVTLIDGTWQSYNVDASLNLALCQPTITAFDLQIADLDGNVLEPDENGEYVLEADSYFTMKLINAELSDGDPFRGDETRTLVTRSRADAMADEQGKHLIIEAMPEDTMPYTFHVLTTDVGYSSYAGVRPSEDLYCLGELQRVVIRSKAKE